jgi:hypothetical protein
MTFMPTNMSSRLLQAFDMVSRMVALLLAAEIQSAAGATAFPQLNTHEAKIEALRSKAAFNFQDPVETLTAILNQLPTRANVYPTENYYYFDFFQNGAAYYGNLRFDVHDRDHGKVHLSISRKGAVSNTQTVVLQYTFDGREDVQLTREDFLTYRLTSKSTSVQFKLNALRPEIAGVVNVDEQYIGPVFDDSGVAFHLVYNAVLKIFLYVLDERSPNADNLELSEVADGVHIGGRTGFAYYNDTRLRRNILIGVLRANALANNNFDGPFDQLPDNYIIGNELRDAIAEADPKFGGEIDLFGQSQVNGLRYVIAPYRHYINQSELSVVSQCIAWATLHPDKYYGCFAFRKNDTEGETDLPIAYR